MSIYSVDRIEGTYAVLVGDDGDDCSVLLTDLPEGMKEGAVVRLENGAYALDESEQQSRRSRVLSLQEKLRRKNQT